VTRSRAQRERLLAEIEAGMNYIARVANSRRLARRLEERSGVALGQLTVLTLAAIQSLGPARLTQVADEIGYEPSRVSKEVQRLLAAGLVDQERDRSDKRAYLLTITDNGTDVYRRYRRAVDALVAEALDSWSDHDLRQLARFMTRLANRDTILAPEPSDGDA
jgi:DNA-binding MarR family transcriptional regulator